jgi:LuxR family transcriptional regulator, maltose regulon positive regulatory protein
MRTAGNREHALRGGTAQQLAKFCPPRSTSALIARPGLSTRVELGGKLTLLLAPPGSGKSTLLAQWSEQAGTHHRVAWQLCGRRDRDAVHFFASLATSIHQALSTDDPVSSISSAMSHCSAEHLVDVLSDQLGALQDELIIAIDDLQFIDCADGESRLWSLIAQSAPCVRWIIATRRTPRFDLQRLKLVDELTLLNGADLSFAPEQIGELALLLNGQALAPLAIIECARRTEGWIAGVKLMLLDGAGADALNHDIAAYLNSAGWESLSDELRDALLATCLPSRFCAELTDALLGAPGSGRLLEEVERLQLFLQPLDARHRWLRYHTLYREFLVAQLGKLRPGQALQLHRAASHWFADQELPAEALHHAFATEDRDWCVQLVARCVPVWLRTGEFPEVLQWTSRLSPTQIMSCIAVRDAHLMSLIFSRHFERARAELAVATRAARTLAESQALPALQLMLDIMTDAGVHVTAHQVEALSLIADPYLTANLYNVSAYQLLVDKKFDAARRLALRGRELLAETQHVYALAQASVVLMLVDRAEGHAREAAETCMQLYARTRAGRRNPIWVTATTAAASVHYHHNRLQQAEALCSEVLPLVSIAPSLENLTVAHVVAARLKCAAGKHGDALRLLDYLHSVLESSNCQRLLARVCFEKVRIYLLLEQPARALAVLAEFGQAERDGPWEDFALSRVAVLIHRGSFDAAASQLQQLCERAESAGDVYGQIRLEATLATCNWQARDEEAAFRWINHALVLTENRGFSRAVFDDVFGLPKAFAAAIRRSRVTRLPSPEYFQRFQDVLLVDPYKELIAEQPQPPLLTQRELDLLKLVSMGLTNRDISERSNITLLTTKWHLKNVFAKLGVSTRMEAVFRAQQLHLVDGRPPTLRSDY